MAKYSMNYFVKAAGVLLFCLNIHIAHAKKNEVDSLRDILPGAPTIKKIEINYLIGSQFSGSLPDSALPYYNEGLKLSRVINNDTLVAKCLNKIGILKFNSGEYETAIRNLYSALKIFEQHLDKSRAMRCLQYLGMAYKEQGMYDKALDYANQSLEIARAIGSNASMAVSLTNIGSVYYSQSNYDKALGYFEQALHITEKIKDPTRIADALNNVALIYGKKKDPHKSLEVHLRSLALAKEISSRKGIAAHYHNIGLAYKDLAKFSVAIQYLDSCIALAKEGDDKFYLQESYNTLSEVYSDMGNFEKAYHVHLLFSKLNDTLMSEENKRQFAEMNTKYESDKKDNQISLLKKDKDFQEEKMRKEKIIRNSFMGGFAIVLLFASVFFRQKNKTKKEKLRAENALAELKSTQEQLVKSEKLAAFGSVATRMAHEIQNPLNFVNNFSELSNELVKDVIDAETPEEKAEAFQSLTDNLEKINLHGNRASDIVNQLQEHIRAGTAYEFFEDDKK
jgi:two-component system NtrC family sensor kinase